LSQKEQDKLVDAHFVPKEIRKRYATDNAKKGILEGAFPHRLIETGQGRHGPDGSVQDEFSDPFHWETQSQCETFYVMEPINNPLKTLSVQEQIERNNFVLATPPTSQKLPKKLTAPPTPNSGKKGKRAKPLPPPRSASTRRISNATNPSSGTSSSTATPTSPTHHHQLVTNNNHVMKSAPAEPNISTGYQSLSSESSGAFHSISAGGLTSSNTTDTFYTIANSIDTTDKDCLVSPSTPKAFHHKPRSSTYASSQRSKPAHSGTPTHSTPDTHTSRDQNDNFENDDEDTILIGGDEGENIKQNDNHFDFLLNW
jgi:hypothetical protein